VQGVRQLAPLRGQPQPGEEEPGGADQPAVAHHPHAEWRRAPRFFGKRIQREQRRRSRHLSPAVLCIGILMLGGGDGASGALPDREGKCFRGDKLVLALLGIEIDEAHGTDLVAAGLGRDQQHVLGQRAFEE
jgi:hypothetical protein